MQSDILQEEITDRKRIHTVSEGHWIAHLGQFIVNVDTVVTMWITMGILIVFAFLATRKMSIIPTKLQAVAEGILGAFVGLTDSMIGKNGRKHIPLLATLFLFILTANYIEQIPYELQDRLEIIEVPSYTEQEKQSIAKDYLIPKQLHEHGLTEIEVQFTDDAIIKIINNYTKEAGVRELERLIATILRKIVRKILTDKTIAAYVIDEKQVETLLGKGKYEYEHIDNEKRIGVVNGMAYTVFGGDILPIEATYYSGEGKLLLTGSLGKVMQESAQIALSYVESHAKDFNIDEELMKKINIHIHVPDGAIKKDGPSAGVALATTLVSLLSKKAVPSDISMTGEITLRGKILPIGGLREKVIGSKRAGIKKIFVPQKNKSDIDELAEELKEGLQFIYVDEYFDIYNMVFKNDRK